MRAAALALALAACTHSRTSLDGGTCGALMPSPDQTGWCCPATGDPCACSSPGGWTAEPCDCAALGPHLCSVHPSDLRMDRDEHGCPIVRALASPTHSCP